MLPPESESKQVVAVYFLAPFSQHDDGTLKALSVMRPGTVRAVLIGFQDSEMIEDIKILQKKCKKNRLERRNALAP
ncbi:hypothetical protein CLAFUW4_07177 [Fulvia fulva]|uniref:Uncharacterized protein n=1 Tax=Passalora fulva TaxID=5499 RepID=A0A9Q8UR18_PASFU|nr:uncharacterized protein CLAFUR5_07311 [Fulvia fulva]KAK4621682.1 hypothetical protein CLAFUR4_07185 [Fulvia fulva]UJO19283.1 hypothetical protein CLAFUR5_07311 [Fulvia fulva]WPV16828.1 hypothetical protein CLAFUW4_07177 [Fulvia fulva]WPV31553.1 hypothetical protein CLAFUW7_07178 [Fulvia fulva]